MTTKFKKSVVFLKIPNNEFQTAPHVYEQRAERY